ncbi:MAG: protein kinase [Thermoanaerobaculia bacterium]
MFERVCDAPPAGRALRLDELAGGDAELRAEVAALLASEEDAGEFLEQPLGAEFLPASSVEATAASPPEAIGPYRILREIGAGGMGTVYQAVHRDYPKSVALKVIRSHLDGDLLRRRFQRERDILAALDHASIARLYDGGRTSDGSPFIAMELVDGPSLGAYAARAGLALRERIELFLRVCGAVEFAHARGVVHRDLKPSNILVDGTGCPKLLDFGVAKLVEGDGKGDEATLTAAGLMTPEYASPEQVRGGEIGPASDIYSLGVVLYELLTGRRPYELRGRTAREVEVAVCEVDPERPSTAASHPVESGAGSGSRPEPQASRFPPSDGSPQRLRRQLAGDLDAIVLKTLRKSPADRYPTVAALAEDLRRYLAGLPVRARRGSARYRAARFLRRHRLAAASAALFLVAVAGGFALARWRVHGAPSAAATPPKVRSAAVLGFTDLSSRPDQRWIGGVLTEMLRTELGAGSGLRAAPGELVAQARTDLAIPDGRLASASDLALLFRRLGVELVVEGAYLGSPEPDGALRVDLRVLRAPGGEVVAQLAETGTEREILDLVARTGFELRSRLGVTALSPAESGALVAERPADATSARLFAEGVAESRRYSFAHARALLEETLRRIPAFAPAHFELATVLARQGFDNQANAEISRAVELSTGLSRPVQLLFAARRAYWSFAWDEAIAAYRELLELDPENLEAGLGLAQAQVSARRTADAAATIAALRRLPAPLADDPRIDLLEARVARGSPAGASATQRAVAKAEALAANLLLAQARLAEGAQFWDSPQIERVLAPFAEARRLRIAGGDRIGAADVALQIGLARWRAGAADEGEREVSSVVAAAPAIELPAVRRDALDFLGTMRLYRGDLDRSRECFTSAEILSRDLGADDFAASHRGWLGVIAYLGGDMSSGRRQLEAAHQRLVELDAEFFREDLSLALGWMRLEGGDPDAALRLARAAEHGEGGAAHERLWTAESLWLQGEVLAARGDLAAARARLAGARSIYDGSSLRHLASEIALAQADLMLAAGDATGGEALAREATGRHRRWSELAYTFAAASGVWTRALLAQGRIQEARAAFAPLRQAAARGGSRLHRWAVDIVGAELEAAQGATAVAATRLTEIVAESRRLGYAATARRAQRTLESILAAPRSDPPPTPRSRRESSP